MEDKLLLRYKELLRALQKNGRSMHPLQRQKMVRSVQKLEKHLVKNLLRKMLSGAITLNISHIEPPRLRRLLTYVFNRRMHQIHHVERVHRLHLERSQEHKNKLSQISLNFHQKKQLSVLSRQIFNDIQTNHQNHKKNIKKALTDLQNYNAERI